MPASRARLPLFSAILLALATVLIVLLVFAPRAGGQAHTWTVASTGDDAGICHPSSCTLRQAIRAANDSNGPDRIRFNIASGLDRSGRAVIRLSRELDPLADEGIEIDATTQPGWRAGLPPRVYLDGSGAGDAAGITVYRGGAVVRGLGIGGFQRQGIGVFHNAASGAVLEGNWIGMTPDGRAAAPNRRAGIGVLGGAADVRVGGECPGCGNRLAGNAAPGRAGHGVVIGGQGSVNAFVAGNVIGLGAGGAALANDDGVLVVDGAQATVRANVIAASLVAGIEVRGTSSPPTEIDGNWIGVAPGGAAAANDIGIFIGEHAADVEIGLGGANVVAGNRVGIAVEQLARNVRLERNWIGLVPSGFAPPARAPEASALSDAEPLPNRERGVSIVAGANTVYVRANYVLAGEYGVVVRDAATSRVSLSLNQIAGARGGGAEAAIDSSLASEVMIGGEPGLGNILAGADAAVRIAETSSDGCRAEATEPDCGTKVGGNRIGAAARPRLAFRDIAATRTGRGVVLERGAAGVDVKENWITGLAGAGIAVLGGDSAGNLIADNVFTGNGGPDIDLGGDGPTPNDAGDADRGPNGLINAPRILEYEAVGQADPSFGYLRVNVAGDAPPDSRVRLYAVDQDVHAPIARGQADSSGRWQALLSTDDEPLAALRALAIGPDASTSEFSAPYLRPETRPLQAGFRWIAWLGPERPVADALADLGERVVSAARWDAEAGAWRMWSPRAPQSLATFSSVGRGDVLLINLESPWLLTLERSVPAGEGSVRLAAGLNFTAWMGGDATAAAALRTLEARPAGVWALDGETGEWVDLRDGDGWSTAPLPGNVLAIQMNGPAVWNQVP